jgi:hypothetical protein
LPRGQRGGPAEEIALAIDDAESLQGTSPTPWIVDEYQALRITAGTQGIGAVSIDGGAETNVDFYAVSIAPNVLLYMSPALCPGSHTLRVRVTGTRNAAATDSFVAIDRVQVIP